MDDKEVWVRLYTGIIAGLLEPQNEEIFTVQHLALIADDAYGEYLKRKHLWHGSPPSSAASQASLADSSETKDKPAQTKPTSNSSANSKTGKNA